jgi:hypothetical protein
MANASALPSTEDSKVARKACGHWGSDHKSRQTAPSSAGASAQKIPGSSGPKIKATGNNASHCARLRLRLAWGDSIM